LNELHQSKFSFRNSAGKHWGRPEQLNEARPVFVVNASRPGSDLLGSASAALSAAAMALKSDNMTYSSEAANHAVQLYRCAKSMRISDAFGLRVYLPWMSFWRCASMARVGPATKLEGAHGCRATSNTRLSECFKDFAEGVMMQSGVAQAGYVAAGLVCKVGAARRHQPGRAIRIRQLLGRFGLVRK